MTPAKVKKARHTAGLTQEQAAKLVFVSVSAWRSWEQGARNMPRGTWELFRCKEKLERVRQDINWMLNNRKFLSADVFDYLDK